MSSKVKRKEKKSTKSADASAEESASRTPELGRHAAKTSGEGALTTSSPLEPTGPRHRSESGSNSNLHSRDRDETPTRERKRDAEKTLSREARKSERNLLPIVRQTSNASTGALLSPVPHKPTGPVVEQHPDWFVEEPSKSVEIPQPTEYKHIYAKEYSDEPHCNFVLTQSIPLSSSEKKETIAKAIVSVLKTPEKTQIGKFFSTGNTHRVLVQHETGFEESLMHNIPAVSEEEFPSKLEAYLKSNMAAKDLGIYLVHQNEKDVKADICALEAKHTRKVDFMKIAVLYAKPGQTSMDAIWKNNPPQTSGFYTFLNSIAQKVDLETWTGYRGDMGNIGQDAKTGAFHRAINGMEVIFHVAPWMTEEQHRRLCGNDVGVLIFYDSVNELRNMLSVGPSEEKTFDKRLITKIYKEVVMLDKESMQNFSKNFFKTFFDKSPDAKDFFNDTIGTSEWRMTELLKKMLDFVARVADEDPSITAKSFNERKNFYAFLGLDEEIFGHYNAALVQALKHAFTDHFTRDHHEAWKIHLQHMADLCLGTKEFVPKRSPAFVPFDTSAMGNVPQVFGVVEPHPTDRNQYRIGFFQRPIVGAYAPQTPPYSHYFGVDDLSEFMFTKFHNGFMKANNVPPFDRLFSVPRREAIKGFAEKYPRAKTKREKKLESGHSDDKLTVDDSIQGSHGPIKNSKSPRTGSTMKLITGSLAGLSLAGREKEKEKEKDKKDDRENHSSSSEHASGSVVTIEIDSPDDLTSSQNAIADLLSNPTH